MRLLPFIAVALSASAQLPPTVSRRLTDLEIRQNAAIQKADREIRECRKAAGADLQRHAVDLAKANKLEDAATAKRLGDALSADSVPLQDWLKGRAFLRDYESDPSKVFITFSEDGLSCKMLWGETAKVEAITEHIVRLRAPTGMVYFEVALNRRTAAVMATRINTAVWLVKPITPE